MEKSKNLDEFVQKGNTDDLYRFLHKKLYNCFKDDQTPDDIIQGFFCHCANKNVIERFDNNKGASFSSYIYNCFKNYVLAYYGTKAYRTRCENKTVSMDALLFQENDTDTLHEKLGDIVDEDHLYKKYDKEKIFHKLLKVEDPQGVKITTASLYWHIVNGWTDKDIAHKTGLTVAGVGAVKSKLRKELKKIFKVSL